MDANPNILVVLSDDLLSHLRKVAQEKHVPLRWLVAGLVCDTFRVRDRTDDESPGCSHGKLTFRVWRMAIEAKTQVSLLSSSSRKPCLLADRLPKSVLC